MRKVEPPDTSPRLTLFAAVQSCCSFNDDSYDRFFRGLVWMNLDMNVLSGDLDMDFKRQPTSASTSAVAGGGLGALFA